MSTLESVIAYAYIVAALVGGISCLVAPFALRWYAAQLAKERKGGGK
jgi:hypothetical protein